MSLPIHVDVHSDENKNPKGHWRKFSHDELIARDTTNLHVFWRKNQSLTDVDRPTEPDDRAE